MSHFTFNKKGQSLSIKFINTVMNGIPKDTSI